MISIFRRPTGISLSVVDTVTINVCEHNSGQPLCCQFRTLTGTRVSEKPTAGALQSKVWFRGTYRSDLFSLYFIRFSTTEAFKASRRRDYLYLSKLNFFFLSSLRLRSRNTYHAASSIVAFLRNRLFENSRTWNSSTKVSTS